MFRYCKYWLTLCLYAVEGCLDYGNVEDFEEVAKKGVEDLKSQAETQ